MPELSTSNKVLIGLLLATLLTWGGRTYFYTRHLKTQAEVEATVKEVRQEEAQKRSEIMVQRGEAYKQVNDLQRQLNTLTKSKGSKRTLPNGETIEDWETEQSSSLVEKATQELQEELSALSKALEETSFQLSETQQSEQKMKELYDEAVRKQTALQKRFTLLAGWTLARGSWQERMKLGGLLHLGAVSVGLSIAPASAIDEFTKPLDERWENGWLKGLEPLAWGGISF